MNLSNKVVLELYRINVLTNKFEKVDEVQTHKNLRWFDRLNGIGGCTFDMDIKDPKANISNWIPYVTQIAINVNGKIVWIGGVQKPKGNYNGVSGSAPQEAMSYLYHLMKRFLTTKYTNQDAATQAWNFINTVQSRPNGELMIRQGTIETVGNTSDTLQNQAVAQALINQSDNLVGYDFEFVPQQSATGLLTQVNFNVFNQIGVIRSDFAPLEFGFNVKSAEYSIDGEVANAITGEGAGTSTGVLSSSFADGASEITYTRRESIENFKSVLTYRTLNAVTESTLNKKKLPRYAITVALKKGGEYKFGAFREGDIVKTNLEFPNGMIINQDARVTEMAYSVDKNGVISVEPKLEVLL